MNCNEFRDLLQTSSGQIDGEPEAVSHLDNCEECGRQYIFEAGMRRIRPELHFEAPATLWRRISLDIDYSGQRSRMWEYFVSIWTRPRIAATLAIILVIATLGIMYFPAESPSPSTQVADSSSPGPFDEIRLMLEVHESSMEFADYLVGYAQGHGLTYLAAY